jgi:NitT/TauT family transport system substrate-binding protein
MDILRIGHLSTFYHTAFLLMGTDWLAEAGIDARWKLFPSGPDIVKAMESGEPAGTRKAPCSLPGASTCP